MIKSVYNFFINIGLAVGFLKNVLFAIVSGKVRLSEVAKQVYEQGLQSVGIVILTSLAIGSVLAMQSYVALTRFGAKEYISYLVGLSLVRELGPVFTALIFSGKAGAKITAELGSMSVNDQILATRTLGVDPIEFLVLPRMLASFIVLPILAIISITTGIFGGYLVGVFQAKIPSMFYINQTLKAITYTDFMSGFIKVFFFSIIIGWICCFQGFFTQGGSLGVGKYTTRAVAYSYIFVILSNAVLTRFILNYWG